MDSRSQTPPPVNPPSHPALFRPGQSVCHVELDVLGVVLYVRGAVVELAVWPCSRVSAHPRLLRHLTSGDACARSVAAHSGLATELAAHAANRCRPRPRDGRCHWCDRVLEGDELVSPKTATLWKERKIHVRGLGVVVLAGGEARIDGEKIASAGAEGRWIVSKDVGIHGELAMRLLDAIRQSESRDA